MKCSKISSYIIDHVLEELSPDLQIQVNEHLAICKKCQAALQQTEAVINGFKNSARFRPTPNIFPKIMKQFKVPKPHHARFFGLPRGLVYALGAFLLGVIMTKSLDTVIINIGKTSRIEVRQESPRRVPFSDTVEFYSVPAKNLARI
jgi:anti-sigma factor RsiW